MEAAAEVDEITKRVIKKAAKEAKVKAAADKASTDSVSSAGTLSAATAASSDSYTFTGDDTSNSIVVGVAIRSGYTLLIIML